MSIEKIQNSIKSNTRDQNMLTNQIIEINANKRIHDTQSGIRILADDELDLVSGGDWQDWGTLDPITVTAEIDNYFSSDYAWGFATSIYSLPGGFLDAAATVGGWVVDYITDKIQANQEAKLRMNQEFNKLENYHGERTMGFVSADFQMGYNQLLSNGYVLIDRDSDGTFDFVISPPWTNVSGQLMANTGNGWQFGWP